jgi:hypothetical protein
MALIFEFTMSVKREKIPMAGHLLRKFDPLHLKQLSCQTRGWQQPLDLATIWRWDEIDA